jgi:hypothetical protein
MKPREQAQQIIEAMEVAGEDKYKEIMVWDGSHYPKEQKALVFQHVKAYFAKEYRRDDGIQSKRKTI